ncbi:MAG TPA: serine/threonine-protein kinase [Gaiellaceae bacterium]|nr:serine/threonine-protein kinase [Gaiellaceae bacterium]
MATDRMIGAELGGYRIEEPLGRGGTSVVYRAEHVRLGRRAALKLLTPALGEADFSARFLRESQLAASLDHPSIVPVYDAGEQDGVLYIAMACIDGQDLKSLIAEEGALPPRRALRIVGQIASALDAAHAKGLVHRDVKPANILVGEGDRAYLSDFGVVKEIAAGNGSTRTGTFVGTTEYCAPEQIEGRAVDRRTDVYALACVLYECLTGEPPFHRDSEVATLNAHLHAPPPKLGKVAPELPQALDQVIGKALSKSPLDRYASCGELVAAARAAAAERRVHGRRLVLSLGLLAVAALVGAGVALGVRSLVSSGSPHATPPPPVKPSIAAVLLRSTDAPTLGNIAYALIRQKQYADSLPFVQKAIRLATPGTTTLTYATYNYGVALFHLGRCREALVQLRKALPMEPTSAQRANVQFEINRAQRCA